MPLREESEPPQDRSLCSNPYVQCDATYTCVQLPGPQLIDAFVAHKSARGFTVHLIDESDWGGGGDGTIRADNIRLWLKENYQSLNIKYVLLIGDPRQSGDLPMRITKPGLHAEQAWALGPPLYTATEGVPTDYYFAELTATGIWMVMEILLSLHRSISSVKKTAVILARAASIECRRYRWVGFPITVNHRHWTIFSKKRWIMKM